MQPIPDSKSGLRQSLQILLISMALMLFEVNLVRIFSILTYYHLAFFVLAIALFGIGLGALYGQILRDFFSKSKRFSSPQHYIPALLGISVLVVVWALLKMPLKESASEAGISRMTWVFAAFLVAAIPFFWGSWYISSIFASRPQEANRLYFSDLAGASAGCLLAIPSLEYAGGLGTPFVIAAIAVTPILLDASKRRIGPLVLWAVLLCAFGGLGFVQMQKPLLSIQIVQEKEVLFSKWNFFSNITISEFSDWRGWRPSPNYDGPINKHLKISQDGRAPAFIENFDGDYGKVEYLRHDITSLPWRIVPSRKALVIGAGGGRDILTGKLFGCEEITGVELNPTTVEAMLGPLREYSGGIYTAQGVEVAVDNGRNFVAADRNKYDLIFTSLADTQLANPQGAFVLSENFLYTVEAFESYLNRLNPGGAVGCVSSIYWGGQLIRMTSTAAQALENLGVQNPQDHFIVIMTQGYGESIMRGMCVLVFREAVTPETVAQAQKAVDELGYELTYPAPDSMHQWTGAIQQLVTPDTRQAYLDSVFPDLSPLRDDRPYLFYAIKPAAFLKSLLNIGDTSMQEVFRLRAFHILLNMFMAALLSVLVLMLSPLVLFRRRELRRQHLGLQAQFLLVGFLLGISYMLVEISLLQHFFLLLGDPTLTFAVILCAMLAFTGLGSLASSRVPADKLAKALTTLAGLTVAVQLAAWWVMPKLVATMQGSPMPMKFALVCVLLAVLATPMGALFPTTIRLVGRSNFDMTCWLWGMNGVGSVIGSVGATLISMNAGILATFMTGMAGYAAVMALSAVLSVTAGRQAVRMEDAA